jgi:hypothetical protein
MAKDSVFSRLPYGDIAAVLRIHRRYKIRTSQDISGFTYLFHKIPDDASAFIPQIGFDFDQKLIGDLSLNGGYDFVA